MKKTGLLILCLILALCTVPACSREGTPLPSGTSPSPSHPAAPHAGGIYGTDILAAEGSFLTEDFDAVRNHFMFFGHQSVGGNILDGLATLGTADGRYLVNCSNASNWYELSNWTPAGGHGSGGLGEQGVGANGDPESKIRDFHGYISNPDANGNTIGGHASIALYKFCFVDINESTDVDTLLSEYSADMAALETAFPATIFVYMTVPLLISEDESNVRHNQYNALVRSYCQTHSRPLFDIADLEAVNADGTRATFSFGGSSYDKLSLDWNQPGDDHLNASGGQRLAKAMILMFADILKKNP